MLSLCEISGKPVALNTCSTSGQKGHLPLLETLHVIEAKIADCARLLIPYAKTKVNNRNEMTDQKTLTEIENLIEDFIAAMNEK